MKKKLIIITGVLLLLHAQLAFAQQFVKVNKKEFKLEEEGYEEAVQNLKKGDKLYKTKKRAGYKDALHYYLTANNYNSENAALNYLIGAAYLQTSEKEKALPFLEKAKELYGFVTEDIHYLLGLAKQYNYQFEEAIVEYQTYLDNLKKDKIGKSKAQKRIKECNSGIALMEKPVRCFIDNLGKGVNTQAPEYSPVFNYNDSILYFTSRRSTTTGGSIDPSNGLYKEDIYYSRFLNGDWQEAQPLTDLNTKFNEASVSMSSVGDELTIYKGKENGGDLFNAKNFGESWEKPQRLKKINSKNKESAISVTPDGQTVFFISDRNGGQGRLDIWYAEKNEKGNWGKPQNMGPEINTKYDEQAVKISEDGQRLYFSSQGHNSMGGYDVFVTRKQDDGSWSKPENLGYPVNTTGDDIFFTPTPVKRYAYYASEREDSHGDKDIYKIVFLGKEKPTLVSENNPNDLIAFFAKPTDEINIEKPVHIKVIQLSLVKGTVTDAYSGKPITATLELVDNATGKLVKKVVSYPSTGAYTVPLPPGKDYALTAGAPDYFFHSENFVIADTSTHEVITKNIQLQPMGVGAKIVLNNVFFDSGKHTLRPESYSELNRLARILQEYKNLRVEISGHTDSKGSDSFNQKLSQRRAQAVVNYILTQGVNSSQIIAVGYGESQPRADNVTAQGRQLNRRVEAKILEK